MGGKRREKVKLGKPIKARMADAFEDVFFAHYVGESASAVLCGALTDQDIISKVRNAKPVAASDDK